MIETKIVNVIATAALGQEIDFVKLRQFREIFHDSDVYGGRVAYFKTSGMKGKVSIFASGKMISVGTKSEEKAFNELEYAERFLVEKGFTKPTQLRPKIQNIVLTTDFGKGINLEALAINRGIIYEPEQFPGGILRIEEPYRACVLIFSSGKAVVTGLKASNQIKPTIKKLVNIAKHYFMTLR
jgi:transcription initiation factor TFIID TATA-box-binding protein